MSTALVEQKRSEIRGLVMSCTKQIAMALPKHMTAERMVRTALSACQRNPQLYECSQESVALAIINAAELGLEPNALGHAYLVPYKGVCTLIPGYKGLIKLARNSGDLISLHADVVREGDSFEYAKGLDLRCQHKPSEEEIEGRKITHYYAVAHLKNGGKQFEVMTAAQVTAVRKRSPSGSNPRSPWVTDPEEMGKKTVIRRLMKYMPASSELERVIHLDEMAEAGQPQYNDLIDIGNVQPQQDRGPNAGDQVKKRLGITIDAYIPTHDSAEWQTTYMELPDEQRVQYNDAIKVGMAEGLTEPEAHGQAYAALLNN